MIFAHGVGSRGDLPIEFWQFAWAAVAALAISFFALGVLWAQPRLSSAAEGRLVRGAGRILSRTEWPVRLVSLGLFVVVVASALFGTDGSGDNLAPVAIYVVFWVGLQVTTALFGDVWRALNPIETIALLLDRALPRRERPKAPAWSAWLAPLGMLGFLFLELVHPSGDSPRILGWSLLLFSAVMVGASRVWGPRWLRTGDTFAAFFALLGTMSPLSLSSPASTAADPDGADHEALVGLAGASNPVQGSGPEIEAVQLRWRWPFSGLSRVTMTEPMLALVLVVLGGTTFDGFSASSAWRDLVGTTAGWSRAMANYAGLLLSISAVSVLYELGVRFLARTTATDLGRARADFGPSLVPIVLGYSVAHYAQLLVDETQTFVFQLSDPLGRGWNLFGTADNQINFDVISVNLIAWIQVLSIVVGHIVAVMVAHDRAVERYEPANALRSQYAMLVVMVLYSVVGLWLLLNG